MGQPEHDCTSEAVIGRNAVNQRPAWADFAVYSRIYWEPGWGGRDRTSEWRNQNPLPYRLATPQQAGPEERGMAPRGFPLATPVYIGSSAISTGWRLIFGAPASCAVGLLYNAFRGLSVVPDRKSRALPPPAALPLPGELREWRFRGNTAIRRSSPCKRD